MLIRYQISTNYQSGERRIVNALLAIVTGLLTLLYPNFLYLIAGGYLLALGLILIYFRVPAFIAALPIVAGVLIFLFPELIPYTFAVFLGLFGIIFLMAFQFAVLGFLTLIIAVLTIMNPEWVAFMIATFLILYGTSDLIRYFRLRNKKGDLQ